MGFLEENSSLWARALRSSKHKVIGSGIKISTNGSLGTSTVIVLIGTPKGMGKQLSVDNGHRVSKIPVPMQYA